MYRLHIKDIRNGDEFYECEIGQNIKWTALEDAREVREESRQGYVVAVRGENEKEMELFEAYEPYGYGLRLYTVPIYS